MPTKVPVISFDRTKTRLEWDDMRREYHTLVNSIPPSAFRHPTLVTRWTIAEILAHMVQTIELMPRGIKSIRRGKNFMNLPVGILGPINFILIKTQAQNITPQALLSRYDQAFTHAMQVWDGIQDDEWSLGACLFGEGYKTLLDYYLHGLSHFKEHATQIRKSLP